LGILTSIDAEEPIEAVFYETKSYILNLFDLLKK